MAKKPLSPEGGRAPTVATKLPHVDRARLDAVVKRRGQTPGAFMRDAVLEAIRNAENEEVDAKAS